MIRDFWLSVSSLDYMNVTDKLVFKLNQLKKVVGDWLRRKVIEEKILFL